MKLSILCTDGSPLGVSSKSIWGDKYRIGVGGAEMALLTMCEEWAKAGHEVVLFNTPYEAGASIFEQRPVASYSPQDKCDAVIIFRTPNPRAIPFDGLKVWWSCDQYTSVAFHRFADVANKTVCISPYHVDYFKKEYNIGNAISIDLPVRVDDYKRDDIERIPNRFLFSSIPDRGLEILWRMWPKLQKEIPDATLTITSDYRLWGSASSNERHRVRWAAYGGVSFLGAVPRARLIEEQLRSDINLYPSTYEELFCISVAESQVAGAYPITSEFGALPTTNMGITLNVNPTDVRSDALFIGETQTLLSDRSDLGVRRKALQQKAIERFCPDNILAQWDEKVFK